MGKVKVFLLSTPVLPDAYFFLLQWCAETSHLETWSSTRLSRPWMSALDSVFQGFPDCG